MDKVNLKPKIEEILMKNPKEKDVFSETFVYEPENIEEVEVGSLYIVGQLKGVSSDSSHLINLLASTIKREYYSKPQRGAVASLEESLKKANSVLKDLTKAGNLNWLGKINFICASLAKNFLHLTKIGQAEILLLRQNRLTNIGKKLIPSSYRPHPSKIFQNIASGKLLLNDKLILTTTGLLKNFSLEGLKQILIFGQIKQIEKVVKETDFSSQVAILIKITTKEEPVGVTIQPMISQPEKIEKKRELIKKAIIIYLKLSKNTFFAFSQNIVRTFKKLIQSTWSFSQSWKTVPDIFQSQILKNKLQDFKGLLQTKSIRIRVGIILIFLIVLATTFNLIYYQKYQNKISFYQDILNQSQEKLNKINKITYLEPNQQLDFSQAEFNFLPQRLLISSDYLLLISPNSSAIYKFKTTSSQREGNFILTNLPKDKKWSFSTILSKSGKENLIIFFTQPKEFYQYNLLDKTTSYFDLNLPYQKSKIEDLISYRDYLYLFDSKNSQIIKCLISDFSCQAWLKAKEDLAEVVSLAINGSIYLLKSDGTILKYFKGNKIEVLKPQIRPIIKKVDRILTKPEFKNLYLLDKEAKRVIILNKNGELVKQYTTDKFSDLTDFQVTEDEKTIFILSGTKLYQLDL